MHMIFSFLNDLKDNNNREWFHENKKRYDDAKKEFEAMINSLIPQIHKFDPEIGTPVAKECVFRIFRDIRFSKDKTPYKTNFGAFIAKGGRKTVNAGYYIHLDPSQSFLAGGMHMPPPDVLKKVRQEIMYNIDEFKSILQYKNFKKYFNQIHGEKLIRPPKDFPADFPEIDLLKYKSYTVVSPVDPAGCNQKEFEEYTVRVFGELYPLNVFLNRALD